MDMPQAAVVSILQTLEFKVETTGTGTLRVTVPPHRLDVQAGAADLIEEVARIHGYDRLPATLMTDSLPRQRNNVPLLFEEKLRDMLVNAGLQEVITYSLTMYRSARAPLKLPAKTGICPARQSDQQRARRHAA